MRFAYADPPYPGVAHRYPEQREVDHALLLEHLAEYDGWALSTSVKGLNLVLPLCPVDVRTAAWVKTFSFSWQNYNGSPLYAWEPLLYHGGRKRQRNQMPVQDWLKCWPERSQAVLGQKPDTYSCWLFDLLNMQPGDEFFDLFPGSGAVSRAWKHWEANYRKRLFSQKINPDQAVLL